MLIARSFVGMLLVGLMVLGASAVLGQVFPNRPIRIITGGVGGGSDFTARVIAQEISGPLMQPVIVENRPSGLIPADMVSKALPDGYTLLLSGSNFYILTFLQKAPYDPAKDFSFVTSTDRSYSILVVSPSLQVKSVKELIALARAKPGVLNFAAAGVGGPNHLAAELLNAMAGVKIVYVAYKGTGDTVTGLLNGEVQLLFGPVAVVLPHIKSGKMVALGVTSQERAAQVLGVPAIAETLPGYEALSITGIFAPAKTPAAIIKRLNMEIVRVLNQADVKEKFLNLGIEAVGSSPEEFAVSTKSNMAKWGKVIKDAGIK